MRDVIQLFLVLMMQTNPAPAPAPVVEDGPVIYKSAAGPIVLPNRCGELDLSQLGLTCSADEPCPTYLEIASVEDVGPTLVVAGNLHTQSATLHSIVMVSEDAGATWRESHVRLKASAVDQLQFIDFTNGWLAGHGSTVLPRDPFVLITNDGGRAWRKVELFSESRVGVVEDFAFESAKKGWLLVDNRGSGEAGKYELYETQTGGGVWELRSITDKIPAGAKVGTRKPSATARVRVEEKPGLLRVEVRDGNVWKRVSSFKLRVEDCKPDPAP